MLNKAVSGDTSIHHPRVMRVSLTGLFSPLVGRRCSLASESLNQSLESPGLLHLFLKQESSI